MSKKNKDKSFSDLVGKLREVVDEGVNEDTVRREVLENTKMSFKIIETNCPMIRSNVGHSIERVRQIKMESILVPIVGGIYYCNTKRFWQWCKEGNSKFRTEINFDKKNCFAQAH